MQPLRACAARLFALLLIASSLAVPSLAQETAEPPELTLEAIFDSDTFRGDYFRGGRWAQEGPEVLYVESDEESDATHLFRYNLETEERTRLIDGANLKAEDVDRLIQIEGYEYSSDGSKVLLYTDSERVWRYNTKGYYYVYDLEAKELTPVSDRELGFQMFAKFSPSGDRVAFVRDRDLFLVDLSTMEETQLTDSGTDGGIINGTSDWVYEEEFGLRDGFSWSPDGQYVAFYQLDESATRTFEMADLRGQYPEVERFRYPKAGEQNSEIHIGVIDTKSESMAPRFFDTRTWNAGGEEFEYIPQMGWTPAVEGGHKVWIFRMNRDQNDLDFLYGDPASMEVSTILEESSESWIEVETGFSDLNVGQVTYLDDGEHFVWISEQDGFRHLYLYENDGTFVKQLTSGPWDITDFHGLDEEEGTLYFTAARPTPMQRHLFSKQVDLSAADANGSEPVQITEEQGTHRVNLAPDLRYYIDTYSNVSTPPVTSLHRIDGERISVLEDNDELIQTVAEYGLPTPEFIDVAGADGVTLNGWIIKPDHFDSGREYPLLMYVYGGPGSQTVSDAWGGSRYLWHAYLANELGVIVASVDNRGTGARGNAFKTATYKQLGVIEARDQIAAAEALAQQEYVDADRVGIWGWSYGGFMTLMSMLTDGGPSVFDTGIAVAPVTDWRQYDTIYTERYMSTPQRNEEGYDKGAPVNYAENLREDQDLLIVHGDLDDNVHFQNAIQMADAFQEAGKQFDLMVYPGRNHGIYGGNTRIHLYTLMTRYVQEHLKADMELPELTHAE